MLEEGLAVQGAGKRGRRENPDKRRTAKPVTIRLSTR
jgi:hypothetical protein